VNLSQLNDYADLLGVSWAINLFDGGQTVLVGTVRFTCEWGDDERAWLNRIQRHLNGLPWPTEDDPRVIMEGTYE